MNFRTINLRLLLKPRSYLCRKCFNIDIYRLFLKFNQLPNRSHNGRCHGLTGLVAIALKGPFHFYGDNKIQTSFFSSHLEFLFFVRLFILHIMKYNNCIHRLSECLDRPMAKWAELMRLLLAVSGRSPIKIFFYLILQPYCCF